MMSTGINNLQLLGAIQVGKILYQSQPELNDVSLQKRVLHLKDREDLPMKLILLPTHNYVL